MSNTFSIKSNRFLSWSSKDNAVNLGLSGATVGKIMDIHMAATVQRYNIHKHEQNVGVAIFSFKQTL